MNVAGIDAHSSYLVVAIVSKDGQLREKNRRIPVGHPDRLLEVLAKYSPIEVVVETSSAWPWLHDLLVPRGIGFVLAHAKRLRIIAESNYKADDVDAEILARMHLAGLIPRVHPKPPAQREWSRLIRHRISLVQKRTALANQIHGQLHQVGLGMGRGRLLTRTGVRWLRTEAWPKLSLEQRRMIRTHLKLIATLKPMIRWLDRRIAEVAAGIPAARLVQTVPGIGAHRSLVIAAEALPIERFTDAADLVGFSGLAPVTRSTGGRTRHGSLPKGANRWLRGALVRAVVSHVQHTPDSWLTQYYERQKARMGWQVARIAAARKLCRAVHAMLRTGSCWQGQIVAPERGELHSPHADTRSASIL